jgi:Protein of unknown function (DUF3263)
MSPDSSTMLSVSEYAVQPDPVTAQLAGSDIMPRGDDRSEEEVAADAPAVPRQLTDRDRELLQFESQWWKRAGAKEQAIRETFGVSATRYYQMLNALLDEPAALAHDPVLVHRLRRIRQRRGHRGS